MIIHNPILTGSFTVNGTDVASITSSAASITAINSYTASQNILNGTYATTGSNTFKNPQTINSNLIVTGSITAATLVVQTITSSVVYSSGSNVFGNNIANTQVMTGSVNITGSLAVVTTGTEFQVNASGVNLGNALTDSHVISGSLRVNPNGLFVSSSGLVGIGNIVPAYTLDVSGTGRFTSTLLVSSTVTAVGLSKFWDGTQGFNIGAATFGTGYGALYSTGVTPSSTNFSFTSNGLSSYVNATNDAGITINNGSSGIFLISSGNVGINGTTPTSKLHVFGVDATVGNLSDVWNYSIFKVIPRPNLSDTTLMISNAGNTSTIGISAASSTTSAQPLSLNPFGGNVLIATTTDYGYKLALNGQPGCNGYTAWTNWSDSRLKENVTDLEVSNVLDKICAIRPVTYNYNELSGFDEETRARRISGFIAQELMEVFPDMVGTIKKGDEEYYDTNLSNLTLYLVKAIQEQNQTIQSLQEQINILSK